MSFELIPTSMFALLSEQRKFHKADGKLTRCNANDAAARKRRDLLRCGVTVGVSKTKGSKGALAK